MDREMAKEEAARKREEQRKRTKNLHTVNKALLAVKPLLKKTGDLLRDERAKKATESDRI
eukprot:5288539-Pyramimonas_sp.AAC.1